MTWYRRDFNGYMFSLVGKSWARSRRKLAAQGAALCRRDVHQAGKVRFTGAVFSIGRISTDRVFKRCVAPPIYPSDDGIYTPKTGVPRFAAKNGCFLNQVKHTPEDDSDRPDYHRICLLAEISRGLTNSFSLLKSACNHLATNQPIGGQDAWVYRAMSARRPTV